MTTLRDELLPLVDEARLVAVGLGMRRWRVVVRTTTRPTGIAGLDGGTTSDLELTPGYRVDFRPRWRGMEAGLTEEGEPRVTKISPNHTRAQLSPDDSAATTSVEWVLIDGDTDDEVHRCELVTLEKRSLEWRAQLRVKR